MIPKFRAWHKEFKQMLPVAELSYIFNRVIVEKPQTHIAMREGTNWELSDIELMQWTGLYDSDDKEIYDGDIVESIMHTVKGDVREVAVISFGEHMTSDDYYASGAYGFYMKYIISPFHNTERALPEKDLKIIGNIYETPELLEQK